MTSLNRQLGAAGLEEWLRSQKVRNAAELSATVVAAAQPQHTALPGQQLAGQLVATLRRE
jgi:hypothetical protein